MHRAETAAEQHDDYFVLIKRCGRRGRRWTWEIRRRLKPLGAKFAGAEYATPQEAKLAGEKELKELLHNLALACG